MSSSNEFFLADATLYASHANYEDMVKQIYGYVNIYGPVKYAPHNNMLAVG